MSVKNKMTYRDAGVDVKAGENLVESIKGMVRETHNDLVLSDIGGFGGFYRPDFTGIKEPVLVSSVDGVGTKLKVAFKANVYDTIGQDLVNHCVNDIAVCGATPLFFLDYFSTGKLHPGIAIEVIKGFTIACKQNQCALIGGETAEMPDIYEEGEFDLAGTIVGVVDRDNIFNGSRVQKGDILLGFESSGLHTNGYSLARKVLFSSYKVDDYVESLGCTIGEALLTVHRSYLPLIKFLKMIKGVHAFSHITGGGIVGNTKRILPDGCKLEIDWNSWQRLPIFDLIQREGDVPENDMREAFNLGIGLIAIVSKKEAGIIIDKCKSESVKALKIGRVI